MARNMHVKSKFTDMFKYVIKRTDVLRNIFLVLTLMTIGATSAWGQVGTDYSGVYYIASDYQTPSTTTRNYNFENLTENFYLCPTESWISFGASGANKDTWTTGDDKPFLTTYKVRSHASDPTPYDITKAKWTIEYFATENGKDYYYIKHSSGKYLVLNKQIDGVNGNNNHLRIRVHLESLTSSDLENDATRNNALFTISRDGRSYIIDPKTQPTFYLTVNKGNFDYLEGRNVNNPGSISSTYYLAGTIGIYQGNTDDNRYLYLEDVITRPTIAYNSSSLIEITAAQTGEGITIKYTTDGSTPSRTNGTVYTEAFDPAEGVTTIRAIAYGDDWESNIATYTPTVLCGTTHKRLIQSQNNEWTTGDHQGFHFYMIPGDVDNSVVKVNTTSVFRPSMEWYFKSAGVVDGVEYYYIVNYANSKYLAYDGSKVYMDTGSEDNKFKFRIVESPTAGTYNIRPYGNNNNLNKSTDNANNGVINLNSSNTSGNTRWKFVTKSALDETAPFTLSDGSSRTHYQLRSSGDEFYVKAPAAANANATMVAAASADKNTYWYLEQAAAATSEDWLTYYYIRNAQTEEYLYYTGTTTSDGKVAFKTSAALGTGDDLQRYYFAWARSTTADYYFIVPKMVRDQTLNNISTMDRFNTTQLRVTKVRATGTSAWSFVPTPFCLDPVITQAVDREVTITCPTPGVTIYYTTDGSDPTTSSTLYEGPFVPADNVDINQIKAIAVNVNDNNAQSAVVTFTLPKYTYHIVNLSGELAVSKADVQQAAGTPLSGYSSIPTDLQSSYISDEEIKFYSWDGAFDASKLTDENKKTETPAASANIYITYTTEKLGDKFLPLTNSAPFNIKDADGKCRYVGDDELKTDAEAAEYKSDREHLWYFLGADPYHVTVQNVGTSKWLTYSDPTLSVGGSSQIFILKSNADPIDQTNTKYEDVTLMDGSGNTFTIGVNTVVLPIRFTLIDRQNKVIQSGIEYDGSLALPVAWRSPLASYHYWNADAFSTIGTSSTPFVFKDEDSNGEPDASEITNVTQVGTDNVIYVTYDVDNEQLDLDGRNSLEIENKVSQAYRLQFSGGTDFYQEDGLDGVMTETRKPVYPYSNGDAQLYVYGNERWELQLASGATTRTRWLWYIEPARKLTKANSVADLDPYHVRISSYQTQTSYKYTEGGKDKTRNFHSYLKTYKPEGYNAIVTGVTNDNPLAHGGAESDLPDNSDATEYMILGTSLDHLKLVTVNTIPLDLNDDGDTEDAGENVRRTVNSFEQYWKNNPTVQDKLTTEVTAPGRNVTLSSTQKTELETVTVKESPKVTVAWHVYSAWANSQPWVHNGDAGTTTGKKFLNEEHVFQTISMGDGTFQFVETDVKPMLILLDQHGWEIVRLPLPTGDPTKLTTAQQKERKIAYANLHKYSSPMVEKYHYWKTGSKVPGYPKYKVSDYATKSDDTEYTTDELGRADITVEGQEPNLPDYQTQALVDGKERDWYVTYDVKAEYASKYAGAATKDATSAAPYLIEQNGSYAQISGTSLTSTNVVDLTNVPETMQWYVRPNFDIDEEMGYHYSGEYDEKTKDETEQDYVDGVEPTWSNGFDPYNVQIQSVKTDTRYFTSNTTSSAVTNKWAGTSSTISLQNLNTKQSQVNGLDQTKLDITNATFMVVADGKGNMRLMPRFDNTKVMQSFSTLASPSISGADSIAQAFTLIPVPKVVKKSSDIKAMGGYYVLDYPFTADVTIGSKGAPFQGTIEGQIDKSFSVSAPFIAYADGATIKNVIIESASVSSSNADGHAGAIVATATGATRIYNCGVNGGSVSGTNHVGGIVGHLDHDPDKKTGARVINCYSYANIESGTDKGGIVGYNTFKSTAGDLRTMVMNCAFYGDISDGNNVAPIYGGEIIENRNTSNQSTMGLANYNYYAYDELKTGTINKYNCALAVEEKYLNRFEFYRLLLNSNKRLAAYYITGNSDDTNLLEKWVLETADRSINDPKPYPVLKKQGKYPSIINYDTRNLENYSEEHRNEGLKTGELTVTISGVGTNAPTSASITHGSLTLTRTDKDFERFNFNYDKVQLPYYDEVGTGNYGVKDEKSRVMVGWKITGMTVDPSAEDKASQGTFTKNDTWDGYNFADRKTWAKDLYSESDRIFSQGAYFDVPYGVTGITIEPYWAEAVYVADEYLDVVYDAGYASGAVQNLGKQFPTGKITIGGEEQTVYTSVSAATAKLGTGGVYDNAIVLVGNLHQGTVPKGNSKKFTMMSVDLDEDHEPDYSMIYSDNNRTEVNPIRFDFINMPGTAQAQKPNTSAQFRNAAVFDPNGWFEVTNTCLIYFSQFEYENRNKTAPAPIILLGGVFDQFVSTKVGAPTQTTYIHVGSNVWFNDFGNGTHSDGSGSTKHVPVSVTGGEYKGFYLTGTYNANAAVSTDNAECYISGGHFVECAGAGLEQIDGNVQWQIYNADIDNFYGGGINDAKPILGTITTDIFNSHVGTFCGGPKFGNMATGKDVTTTAKGCTFDKYFGAGYGGNSISKKKYYDKDDTPDWTNLQKYYIDSGDKGKYYDGTTTKVVGHNGLLYGYRGPGVAVDFDYEFFVWTSGKTGVRFYVNFATFSLAQCHNVSSTLTGCTINQNFYGGGSLGNVTGKATSVLDGCTVHGNVFGAGYSASLPQIPFRTGGFKTGKTPNINTHSGMFEPGVFSDTLHYEWRYAADESVTLTNGGNGINTAKKYVYSTIELKGLGQVGETDLTVKGNTVVEGKIFNSAGNATGEQTGGVFGGGDESGVNGDTKVRIQKADEGASAPTVNNVFGGGNTADVNGKAVVMMSHGTVSHDIYGGGKGETTTVQNDVIVHIGKTFNDDSTPALSGEPVITGSVYGGSALGNVNATKEAGYDFYTDPNSHISHTEGKSTTVNIYAGTINESVYGGGLGDLASLGEGHADYDARNFGPTAVNIEGGTVSTAVFGGANVNGVVKSSTAVTITGGTIGTEPTGSDPITNAVFGGGYGQPTLVEGNVTVNIGTEGQASDGATINGHVYGGGALGCVNASKSGSDPMVFYNVDDNWETKVYLYKGLIKGNVFGGGLGQQEKAAVPASGSEGDPGYVPAQPAMEAVEAFVGGDVLVLLDGAQLNCTFTGTGDNRMPQSGQIFGANNWNGTPKGHVKVHVKQTVGTDKTSAAALEKTRDERGGLDPYSYDVAAVYGGGNQADYVPTDALLDPAVEGNKAKIDKATAEVLIEGCDETSIEYVYGGGNAAAVPATDVTILGSYIIDYVFGGGNGKSTATFNNPGANVGTYNDGTDDVSYGSGKAVTKLVGIHAHYVFGGSNTKGNIREGTSILMPDASLYPNPPYKTCCAVRDIKEIYGAGNEAEQDGNVTLILGCVSNMKNVYGGARKADVKGGIDLVVTSGSFEGVYGGNDMSGTIQGPITVTIEETGCEPLIIDNLYLGGNLAAYSIYGYKNTGTEDAPILVARTKAEYDALKAQIEGKTEEVIAASDELKAIAEQLSGLPYSDPVLNVVSCTRIGKTSGDDLGGAFGGGFGNGAVMHGSPTVNINMIPGDWAKKIDANNDGTEDNNADALGTITNVYGGGKLADVEGSTTVNIGTEAKMAHRTSMGTELPVDDRVQKDVLPAIITENVFGAGKGKATVATDVDSAFVSGNTTIVIEKATITKSVYGGGQLSQVGGNTNVTINGGTIGKNREGASEPYTYWGGAEYGNVYGAGLGSELGVGFGQVKGNTNITITNGTIYHNIYGGGALASVGTFDLSTEDNKGTYSVPSAGYPVNWTDDKGKATIIISGGTIGIDGHENGMVFGSSRGLIGAPDAIHDKLAWVHDTDVRIGTPGAETGPTLHGSLYGGGENGHVYNDASVIMNIGTVGNLSEFYAYRGNVYGAGCGTDMYYSSTIPDGHTDHDGAGDKYNPLAGFVGHNATVIINGGNVANNVYGAGSMGKVGGSTSVTINTEGSIGVDGTHDDGNVYGAARGELDLASNIPSGDNVDNYSTVTNSSVTLTKGTVKGSLYGGGKAGVVHEAVTVNITGGTVKHDVYGAGALANTNTANWVTDHLAYTDEVVSDLTIGTSLVDGYFIRSGAAAPYTYTPAAGKAQTGTTYYRILKATNVTMTGGTIEGNLYGGGLGQKNGVNGATSDIAANVYSPVVVKMSGGVATNVFGCNNLNGAPHTAATVIIDGGTIANDVFGGGNVADFSGSTVVMMYDGQSNRIFGGGNEADVAGSVNVVISGGKVSSDVYGGGALAETNTANWVKGSKDIYVEVVGLSKEKYIEKLGLVADISPVAGLYIKTGEDTYAAAAGYAVAGTKYYERIPASDLKGLYTRSGDTYTEITSSEPYPGSGTYYERRTINGDWASDMNENSSVPVPGRGPTSGGTKHKTLVTLTGGVVGNVYGGGLGRLGTAGIAASPAVLYTVEDADYIATYNAALDGAVSTSDINPSTSTYYTEGEANAHNAGLDGAIKVGDVKIPAVEGVAAIAEIKANVYGDVRVSINKTDSISKYGGSRVAFTNNPISVTTTSGKHYASVPTTGRVFGCNNLNGCPMGDVLVEVYSTRPEDGSSGHKNYEIQNVYGGGDQAAYLPNEGKKTWVVIDGCGETSISRVYGGGNSASVPETDVTIWGSYDIEYAFGGGNGSQPVNQFGNWVDNSGADVNGAARITCHGGKIGQVFGGSDAKGDCRSTNPTLEQAGGCPLVITKLYGAGSEANVDGDVNVVIAACSDAANSQIEYVCGGSYKAHISGDVTLTITSGYFKNVYGGNDERGGIGGNITVNIEESDPCSRPIIIGNLVGGGNRAKYPGTDKDDKPFADKERTITVNVKSATRIENVYGGSFIEEATANTKVNINMVQGNKHNKDVLLPIDYEQYSPQKSGSGTYHNITSIATSYVDITDKLTVGTSSVAGYYTDASCTTPASGIAQSGYTYYEKLVTGHIADAIGTIGNVFGGGQQGKVYGDTEVNIGTEPQVKIMDRKVDGSVDATIVDGKITSIKYHDENVLGAHITGDVFGGGELADVTGNTTVNICAKDDSGYAAVAEGTEKVTIAGNVLGGGKGKADSFTCAKAMVGVVDDGIDGEGHLKAGGTKVVIGNGTISGNVYGGGEVGRVERNTAVTVGIGAADTGSAPVVTGSVFGGGKGVKTHGYSALVRGNSTVTIEGNAKVKTDVYGGGELATVGRYKIATKANLEDPAFVAAHPNVKVGMPYETNIGGDITLTIRGKAQIGPDGAATATAGHVYGAGKGVAEHYAASGENRSKRMVTYDGAIYTIDGLGKTWDYYEADHNFVWEYFNTEDDYQDFLQTLALASDTEVTLDANTAVKGNVYGGSENGFVQRDTDLKIQSPSVVIGTEGSYGNVFGGGKGLTGFEEAGHVKGKADLTITGGTIWGTVYGGGELGFVGKFYTTDHRNYTWYKTHEEDAEETGVCTVAISGSTTVKGSVFGAGKGKDDTFECEQAMVRTTSVTITAGTVNGNVYGGGEVGRVDQNAVVTLGVENASEGTAPDIKGSVFGAGQGVATHGYSGLARGNTTVTVQGTTKVGKNVYGGGEVAAVGRYGLDSSGMPSSLVSGGECTVTIQDHAVIGYDGGGDVFGASKGVVPAYSYDATNTTTLANSSKRMTRYTNATDFPEADKDKTWNYTNETDHTYVWEYFDTKDKYLNFLQTLALATDTYLTIDENVTVHGSAYGGSESGFVQRDADVKIKGSSAIGTTSPVLIGHVYGGGKGVSGFDKAGRVRGNTFVTISETPTITGNVYGGGMLGFVGNFNYSADGKSYEWQKIRKKGDAEGTKNYDTGSCTVSITGGTIGSGSILTANHASGHVFGASKGEATTFKCEPGLIRTASVSITNGTVYGGVHGGGEIGRVDQNTVVAIGSGEGSSGGDAAPDIKGNVYGAGAGVDTHGYSALVRGNTTVTVEGNAKVQKNVYGGGEIAAVGKYMLDDKNMPYSLVEENLGICTVTVRGYAEIGYSGAASDAGQLFGASKGVVPQSYTYADKAHMPKRMTLYTNSTDFPSDKENVTWEYYESGSPFVWEYFDTEAKYKTFLETLALTTQSVLTVGGHATIKGNVYGGSENGFVQHHVSVTMNAGEIGTVGSYGNIYGGGKGLEGFDVAGRVSGNVTLTINNGTMHGSVYGGGEMGIVKKNVTVDMVNGTVDNNLYGGGALADTNTENWDASANAGAGAWTDATKKSALYTTHVSLRGGTITHDAYGGALGRFEKGTSGTPGYESLVEPKVYGNILLVLNGTIAESEGTITETPILDTAKGCTVEKVFGCNDLCGTPLGHVKVHVFATQNSGTADVQTKSPNYTPNQGTSGYIAYLNGLISEATAAGIASIDPDITAAQGVLAGKNENDLVEEDQTAITNAAKKIISRLEGMVSYDVQAVYGGGDLAPYVPKESYEETEVIIDGCHLTCIQQVYGGGNAASTPANYIRVNECFLIDELFGGGNGNDSYTINGVWYANPGADVGYKLHHHYDTTSGTHGDGLSEATKYEAIIDDNAKTKEDRQNPANGYIYGTGHANTEIAGGRIHEAYGGSNMKGNIRTIALSKYQASDVCPMSVDKTTGAGKEAEIDGEATIDMGCVTSVAAIYGGSTNADMNSGVTLNITNGTIGKVFGGNELAGTINGPITINVKEEGCQPIFIDELYGGGFYAPYSVYGYQKDSDGKYKIVEEDNPIDPSADKIKSRIPNNPGDAGALANPHRDPQINIISATRIGAIYGGGYKALMVGSPHINVNMEQGIVLAAYANAPEKATDYTVDTHGTSPNEYEVVRHDSGKDAILAIGKIGTIFGGGNEANVHGNTYVDIGTGKWLNADGIITTTDAEGHTYTYQEKTEGVWKWYDDHENEVDTPVPSRKAAFIKGSVYGGGQMGHVGYFTLTDGKPTSCAAGTGIAHVTISNGDIGPDNMKMTADGGPVDLGHVFGAGKGTNLPADDNTAYVDNTEVTINGDAWVKGSVFGGGENGHVLHDTHVIIDGDCQIGNGHILNTTTSADRGVNRRYTAAEWEAGHLFVEGDPDIVMSDEETALRTAAGTMFTASLPECASWPYTYPFQPHDKYGVNGAVSATDGHTFYGNVFGGGSGYFPYASNNWNMKAGWVEGNTKLEIKGGHIMTSAYGGNEMTNVGDGLAADKGKATVIMTGGTLGVPRTLAQIAAHPVTCYLFGSGKGDQHTHFNKDTNVKEVEMEITGGRLYGSVFGGGEDGHVLGDVKMTIGNSDGTGPTIGTWGTSYVDGNIFGGGRGFSGEALTAGNVGGSVNMTIKGGTMLGSIYGGGRLGSVGYGLYYPTMTDPEDPSKTVPNPDYGAMRDDGKMDNGTTTDYYTTSGLNKNGRGNIVINISGGTIGNTHEYVYWRDGESPDLSNCPNTPFDNWTSFTEKQAEGEDGNITTTASTSYKRLNHTMGGNVFGGSMGRVYKLDNTTPISNWDKLAHAKSTTITVTGGTIKSSVYGGSEMGQVEGNTTVTFSGGTIGSEVKKDGIAQYTFGCIYGGGYGTSLTQRFL